MKNLFKILVLLFLFWLFPTTKQEVSSDFKNIKTSESIHLEEETYFDLDYNNAYSIICSHSSINSIISETNPLLLSKKSISFFGFYLKSIDTFFTTQLSQYNRLHINLLVRFRKANIIFPFHYFW